MTKRILCLLLAEQSTECGQPSYSWIEDSTCKRTPAVQQLPLQSSFGIVLGSYAALVIISSTDHLLNGRPQQNGVLKLRRITPLDITERWI